MCGCNRLQGFAFWQLIKYLAIAGVIIAFAFDRFGEISGYYTPALCQSCYQNAVTLTGILFEWTACTDITPTLRADNLMYKFGFGSVRWTYSTLVSMLILTVISAVIILIVFLIVILGPLRDGILHRRVPESHVITPHTPILPGAQRERAFASEEERRFHEANPDAMSLPPPTPALAAPAGVVVPIAADPSKPVVTVTYPPGMGGASIIVAGQGVGQSGVVMPAGVNNSFADRSQAKAQFEADKQRREGVMFAEEENHGINILTYVQSIMMVWVTGTTLFVFTLNLSNNGCYTSGFNYGETVSAPWVWAGFLLILLFSIRFLVVKDEGLRWFLRLIDVVWVALIMWYTITITSRNNSYAMLIINVVTVLLWFDLVFLHCLVKGCRIRAE